MDQFTYVKDVPRTPEGFEKLDWLRGERPDWWFQESFKQHSGRRSPNLTATVWMFQKTVLARREEFLATRNLEEAFRYLDHDLRFPPLMTEDFVANNPDKIDTYRAMFLGVPLQNDGEAIQLKISPYITWEVRALGLLDFVRWGMQLVNRTRLALSDYEQSVYPELLALGDEYVVAGLGPRLFGGEDDPLAVPITGKQLHSVAKESEAFDLRNFLPSYLREEERKRAESKAKQDEARAERAQARKVKAAQEQELAEAREFIGYLNIGGLTPLNAYEAEAIAMFAQYQAGDLSYGDVQAFVLDNVIRRQGSEGDQEQ